MTARKIFGRHALVMCWGDMLKQSDIAKPSGRKHVIENKS
jgi:hypothetical protein